MNAEQRLRAYLRDPQYFNGLRGPITATEARHYLGCSVVYAHRLINKGEAEGWLIRCDQERPPGKSGPLPKSYFLALTA